MICFSLFCVAVFLPLTSLCSSGSVCFQASGNIMPWPTATPNTGRACNVGRQKSSQWPRAPKERSFKSLLAKCGHWILNSGGCLELLWQQEQTTAEVLWKKSKLKLGARERNQAHRPYGHTEQFMVSKVSFILLLPNKTAYGALMGGWGTALFIN